MEHTTTAEKQLHRQIGENVLISITRSSPFVSHFSYSLIVPWWLSSKRRYFSIFFRQILSIVSPHMQQSAHVLATNLGKVLYKLLVELGKLVDKKTTNMRETNKNTKLKEIFCFRPCNQEGLWEKKSSVQSKKQVHNERAHLPWGSVLGPLHCSNSKVQIFHIFNIHEIKICSTINSLGITVNK